MEHELRFEVFLNIWFESDLPSGFFPGGEKLVNPPHPALVPIFQPEPVPLHLTFVPENFYNFSTVLYRF